ncbi:hypothetical protein KY359_00085, partial [Candidatus Woesearchaeota archaeon]|nr:hypothetical protein [Candidatus Woesearchaeota archaeon]
QADARNEKIPRAVGKAIIHPTFVELTKLYFKTLDDRDPAGEDAARRVREAVFTLMEPLERDGNVVTLPCKREAPVGGKEIPYAVNQ